MRVTFVILTIVVEFPTTKKRRAIARKGRLTYALAVETLAAPMTDPKTAAAPSLGDRLRATREARGLSLRELGRAAEVPHATLSLLENGHQAGCDARAAVALARALGVTVEWLVLGDS